jgi:hypothetical protein
VQAGGDFINSLRHPVFTPLEQLWRKLPNEGVFQASPAQPAMLEIGAFRVPTNMTLILGEYTLQTFRFNGVLANDLLPMERQRLPTSLGWDMNFSQMREGNLEFEIIPTNAPVNSRAAFVNPDPFTTALQGTGIAFEQTPLGDLYNEEDIPPEGADTVYNKARSSVLGNPAGSALMPPSGRTAQGPQRFPFTYMVNQNDVVQIRAIIFQPIGVPVGFFQASISGYLIGSARLEELLRGARPC